MMKNNLYWGKKLACQQPGKYKIMVKVVDILGIDTSQTIEVEIK